MPEYVVMFFVAIAALVVMTVYVQRAFQARTRDATLYMVNMASQACAEVGDDCQVAANFQGGVLQPQYEPYYGMVQSEVSRNFTDKRELREGVFIKNFADNSAISSESVQHPPENAN